MQCKYSLQPPLSLVSDISLTELCFIPHLWVFYDHPCSFHEVSIYHYVRFVFDKSTSLRLRYDVAHKTRSSGHFQFARVFNYPASNSRHVSEFPQPHLV